MMQRRSALNGAVTSSISCLLLLLVCFMLTACSGDSSDEEEAPLPQLKEALEGELDALIQGTQSDAARIGEDLPFSGPETDEVLTRLADQMDVIDALTLDSNGIVLAVKPDQYQNLVSTALVDAAWIDDVRDRHEPLLSDVFTALEGVQAVALEYPRHADGVYSGSVSLLIDHINLFDRAAAPVIAGTKYKMVLLQPDGTVLWDSNTALIGLNVLTAPQFQQIPEWIRQTQDVIAAEEGSAEYSFTAGDDGEEALHRAAWTTIRRAGAEWRLVLFWED